MIFARRLYTESDTGDISEDYEAVAVPRAPKVSIPFDDSRTDHRRRLIKIRAARKLQEAGFTVAEIAMAIEVSPRSVKRHTATARELAEAYGRV
jgi:hypothetical protein